MKGPVGRSVKGTPSSSDDGLLPAALPAPDGRELGRESGLSAAPGVSSPPPPLAPAPPLPTITPTESRRIRRFASLAFSTFGSGIEDSTVAGRWAAAGFLPAALPLRRLRSPAARPVLRSPSDAALPCVPVRESEAIGAVWRAGSALHIQFVVTRTVGLQGSPCGAHTCVPGRELGLAFGVLSPATATATRLNAAAMLKRMLSTTSFGSGSALLDGRLVCRRGCCPPHAKHTVSLWRNGGGMHKDRQRFLYPAPRRSPAPGCPWSAGPSRWCTRTARRPASRSAAAPRAKGVSLWQDGGSAARKGVSLWQNGGERATERHCAVVLSRAHPGAAVLAVLTGVHRRRSLRSEELLVVVEVDQGQRDQEVEAVGEVELVAPRRVLGVEVEEVLPDPAAARVSLQLQQGLPIGIAAVSHGSYSGSRDCP